MNDNNFERTAKDNIFDNDFRRLMRAFSDEYPLDRVFAKIMSKSAGQAASQINILVYAELRRIATALEAIYNKMK